MKRHAIAIGKYRARPTVDELSWRAARRLSRRAIARSLERSLDRAFSRALGSPFASLTEVYAMLFEAVAAGLRDWSAAMRRELDERISGKMSSTWEPGR